MSDTPDPHFNNDEEIGRQYQGGVVPTNISGEMKEAYLSYAMSVIVSRALPDVRDGMKPVHRRILYAMYHDLKLTASSRFRKSAAVVGEVLGKYHPHGDVAVYDSMVGMAQDFSFRYPLVIGQGNFGSIDGDSAAAMRYTEAKMSKLAGELLQDIEKNTVDFRANYDGTHKEPEVLPAAVPSLLLNGTLGIAVGMATKIAPHNIGEVIDATIHLIENEKATTEDLLEFVQGPDFPTGGIVYGKDDITHAYTSGRGGIVVRGETEVIEEKRGSFQIIISSLPHRVNKAKFIITIADLVRDKKIDGIKDVRDESTKDTRVVIDLKSTANPQKVLNYLYKHTQLEETFHTNMVALVDGVPQTLSLKAILEEFIKHREDVVKRRSEYDLAKAEARAHILEGLKKALDHIDEVIKVIKKSKDTTTARTNLMKQFSFTETQAQAILDMKLQKLAGLERKQIEDELEEKKKLIAYLQGLLKSRTKMRNLIAKELKEQKEKYADDRRTRVVKSGVKEITDEDLIPEEETVLVYTKGGYIKRTNPKEYRTQKRGGVGVVDIAPKEEDFVTTLLTTSTHSNLLFFSNHGKAYQLKMYEIPQGKRATKGKSIMNFLQLEGGEEITSIVAMPENVDTDVYMLLVTKAGVAKKVRANKFSEVRRSGLIAMNLNKDDELFAARFVEPDDDIVVATHEGQAIRFSEKDVREMGRTATGVRAIKLQKQDYVVGVGVVKADWTGGTLMVLTENGYGKRTALDEYHTQKRGGVGVKTANLTKKTGKLIAARVEHDDYNELIAVSQKGQIIRVEINAVPELGRSTQGVTIMKLKRGDTIASLTFL